MLSFTIQSTHMERATASDDHRQQQEQESVQAKGAFIVTITGEKT
jgi:hypothetical protein